MSRPPAIRASTAPARSALAALLLAGAGLAAAAGPGAAQDATPTAEPTMPTESATPAAPAGPVEVALVDATGAEVGTATFAEDAAGMLTMSVAVGGLTPGEHGIHVHEVGLCEAEGQQPFISALGHYNPTGDPHGPPAETGTHAGDFGNLVADANGDGVLETVTDRFTLSPGPISLFDANGSALIIHAGVDDLVSQPSGNSGGRVACGVVAPSDGPAPARAASMEGTALVVEQVPFSPELLGRIEVPEGFTVSVFAQGLANPRDLAFGPDGTLYVSSTQDNNVLALHDDDGDGAADRTETVAANLPLVHGIVVQDGFAFLAGETQVWTAPVLEGGGLGAPAVLIDGLPDGGQHPRRTIALGPDGLIYVSLGSSCNACRESNPENATILRFNPDGSGREVFASGLRNTLGWGWHPETGEMWGFDQGSDWRGDDQPPEEVNAIVQGGHYGWPYCYGDRQVDEYLPYPPPGSTPDQFCANTEAPALTYQAHSSPIDWLWADGLGFGDEYAGDAFVTMRGSWNRDPATGYKVVRVDFEGGQPVAVKDFATGWLLDDGVSQFGRLAGLAAAPDGALLVTDDQNGVIYRIAAEG